MTKDLYIKVKRKINVEQLIYDTREVIKNMLKIEYFSSIELIDKRSGIITKLSMDTIGEPNESILFRVADTENIVKVFFDEVKLQIPYVYEEDAGIFAMIRGWHRNSLIEDVLTAALAISIAKICGSNIEDLGSNWTEIEFLSSDEFERIFTLPEMEGDINEKALAFRKLMQCENGRIDESMFKDNE